MNGLSRDDDDRSQITDLTDAVNDIVDVLNSLLDERWEEPYPDSDKKKLLKKNFNTIMDSKELSSKILYTPTSPADEIKSPEDFGKKFESLKHTEPSPDLAGWMQEFERRFPAARNGDYTEHPRPEIMAFISSLLSLHTKKLREKIGKMKKPNHELSDRDWWRNEVINDVLSVIEEVYEKH